MSRLVSDLNGHSLLVPLLAAVAWIITVAAALVFGLALTHTLNADSTPLLVTIIGFAGTLVTIILLVVQASLNAVKISNVTEKVDGHMNAHEQLEQTLATRLPSPQSPPTTGGATS